MPLVQHTVRELPRAVAALIALSDPTCRRQTRPAADPLNTVRSRIVVRPDRHGRTIVAQVPSSTGQSKQVRSALN